MKKRSLFIVVAMVLLLAVVLGMGGTTFAKYITKANQQAPTATVARWGYIVEADATNLFSDAYSEYVHVAHDVNDDTIDVRAAVATNNKVAPGTRGAMTLNIYGTAEVMSKIEVTVTDVTKPQLNVDTDPVADGVQPYEPIRWTVTNAGTTDIGTQVNLTTDQLVSFLTGLSDDEVAPNTPIDYKLTIAWEWPFHVNDTTDGYDTQLGDKGTLDTIGFTLNASVTQIQNP